MIAQAVNMMNFLKGPKQFIIPAYQRTSNNPVFNSLDWVGTRKKKAGRLLEGRTWDEMPTLHDLQLNKSSSIIS